MSQLNQLQLRCASIEAEMAAKVALLRQKYDDVIAVREKQMLDTLQRYTWLWSMSYTLYVDCVRVAASKDEIRVSADHYYSLPITSGCGVGSVRVKMIECAMRCSDCFGAFHLQNASQFVTRDEVTCMALIALSDSPLLAATKKPSLQFVHPCPTATSFTSPTSSTSLPHSRTIFPKHRNPPQSKVMGMTDCETQAMTRKGPRIRISCAPRTAG
jgi:hypothetical protein